MSVHNEERGLRLVHRIEAFSDLVMGFSLALLGLTLVIPAHASALFEHPFWLVGYFWTFAVIALLWFNHQRLFGKYFVPTPLCIVVNFVMLSMPGLLVYFVQIFAHLRDDYDAALALLSYFAALSVAMLCLGTLYAVGVRARWAQLPGEDRFLGVRHALRSIVLGGFLLSGVALTPILHVDVRLQSTWPLAVCALVGVLVSRIALEALRPRIIGASNAAA